MAGRISNECDHTWRNAETEAPVLPRIALLAIAFSFGIALAWNFPALVERSPWPWLLASAAFLSGAIVVRCFAWFRKSHVASVRTTGSSAPTVVLALLLLSTTTFGTAWISIRYHHHRADDLAMHLGAEAVLVRVEGVALESPQMRVRTGGALARFDYREPATYFPMRVEALIDRHGDRHPSRGEVLVRIDQAIAPFRAGDEVETTGFLMAPQPPRNPGEFDFNQYARSLGQAGLLMVRQRELMTITAANRPGIYTWFLDWRDQLRRRAGAWLLSDLPATQRSERDSLLASIMLGLRDEHIDDVYSSFQRVGLAHVLAISGFHLSILAALVLLVARGLRARRSFQAIAVMIFVGLYLLMVEPSMPSLRAGVMAAMACIGLMIGRRINVSGMMWFSAIALLLWRPDQLFSPGFQLSYGVVLGLLLFTRTVERRLPLRAAPRPGSGASMLWHWIRSAFASAVTAWVIATPVVVHHFGLISPLAAALSVITLPLATIILAIGFIKMALAAFLPSAALVVGIPLSICADVLLSIVMTFDRMPLTVLHVPVPPIWWTMTAMMCAIWLLMGDRWLHVAMRRRQARQMSVSDNIPGAASLPPFRASHRGRWLWSLKWLCAAALLAVLISPPRPIDGVRIDMLSVGDGSCYVIRSGDSAVLFDAGSSTDLNIARRSIIPALRRQGVRAIDALIISHADMDHYSAALEIVDEFEIGEALMTPQLFAEGLADPLGPVAYLLDQLGARRIVVRAATTGETRTYGGAQWTWLHPQPQEAYRRSNDDSTVVRIEYHDRAVLLCGDIQQEAMAKLLSAANDGSIVLAADVLELPHHGSHHDTAVTFVQHVHPTVVMQSTGWTRWRQDKWREALRDKDRLVTARDGACTVHLTSDGPVEISRFLESKN